MNQNNKILSYQDHNVIKELAEKDKRIEELESEVELLLSITNLMMSMQDREAKNGTSERSNRRP